MTDARFCPKCGARLPADAPAGICPKCLIEKGMESTVGYEGPRSTLPEPGEPFGPYRIGRLLGRGGMGAVFKAEHIESGRHVALKILNHKLESAEHRLRFLREGRLAASINHPHNVYIYGTEEIDGLPAIAMELAEGGTLQERVKRDGPLAIGEAVDLILQIIAGLEAAESAGVLHRDVKPANCFLDSEGKVKIGDFGLSISTAPRAETNLTQSGVFLGTPAFSSPEQLRGDELDLRSDIYSVGVTLYYLLTGRTPFEAKQMVQFLATVLERPAPSCSEFRPEIPRGLAKVVARCLAKQSSQRFRTYDELRHALLPYHSAAPTPATLGLRLLAFGIDVLVLMGIAALVPLLWARDFATWIVHFDAMSNVAPDSDLTRMLLGIGSILLNLAYFTCYEGIWGATAGKAICRLRVVKTGREPPGLARALLRTCVYSTAGVLPYWIWYAIDPAAYNSEDFAPLGMSLAATVLLFSTARRRNGYAGIHELASGTRVVRSPSHERRPALPLPEEPLPEVEGEQRMGPYHVLGPLESDLPDSLILAYDTRLLRRVWILPCRGGAAPLPQSVRELARIGRLRWLSGERTADRGWDAFEAPSGTSLVNLAHTPRSWDAVRFWLLDLAQELNASLNDDSLPALELDRVWITRDGRAKLLDFPAPVLDGSRKPDEAGNGSPTNSDSARQAAIFLKRVAVAALEGRVLSLQAAQAHSLAISLPISARTLLNGLGAREGARISTAELEAFTEKPAAVSQRKRLGALAACWLLPLLMAVIVTMLFVSERQLLTAHPDVGELCGFVDYYHSLPEGHPHRQAVEIVVVHRFRSTIMDPEVWSHAAIDGFLDANGHRELQGFVAKHEMLTNEQISSARTLLAPADWDIVVRGWRMSDGLYSVALPVLLLGLLLALLLILVILPSLASALFLGDSLLLRALDIGLVTKSGAPASRLRILWRQAVLWFLVLLALGLLIGLAIQGRFRATLLLLIYGVATLFIAERGLQDRIAGTWLVPR